MRTPLAAQLLAWYRKNGRRMPWRGLKDPYLIWVSEIMLQQTQVETVKPYYARWRKRFPNLRTLAEAREEDVLKAWEGLGYYSRARNMLKAAITIIEKYGGRFPNDPGQLEKLPGIGRYTAAAIASLCFNVDIPALDGNIKRVTARLDDLSLPASSREGEARILKLLEHHLPHGEAGDFNQAMMDLGAIICLPKNPACPQCPIQKFCQANRRGTQLLRPVNKIQERTPLFIVTAAIIRKGSKVLITRRPAKGLLGGMWEYPGGKVEDGENLQQALIREIREELGVEVDVGPEIGIFKHAYSHFRIILHAFRCTILRGSLQPLQVDELTWCHPKDLERYPMGKVDRQISHLIESGKA